MLQITGLKFDWTKLKSSMGQPNGILVRLSDVGNFLYRFPYSWIKLISDYYHTRNLCLNQGRTTAADLFARECALSTVIHMD